MSDAVFFRVLNPDPEEKGARLARQVAEYRGYGGDGSGDVFAVETEELSALPESPFAYWVDESIRRIFRRYARLEGNVGTVKVGLQTSNDFRFLRAWWEVDPGRIGFSRTDTYDGRGWIHLAKGGAYSPYYADVHLVVNWFSDGEEIRNFYKPSGRLASRPQNTDHYFRPGLTWPRRTDGLSFRPFPTGSIFADKGPVVFLPSDDGSDLLGLLGIMNSPLLEVLVRAKLARTELAQSYEVGLIGLTPVPEGPTPTKLVNTVDQAHRLSRERYLNDETTHVMTVHPLAHSEDRTSLRERCAKLHREDVSRMLRLNEVHRTVAASVFDLYDHPGEKRRDVVEEVGMAFDRLLEGVRTPGDDEGSPVEDQARRVANLLMWCVGVSFGRWDIRMAKDRSVIPDLQGPFDRLPRMAPGGLVGTDGLPATADQIASEAWLRACSNAITLPEPEEISGGARITADKYPVDVAWDGVLVDDPNHPRDIVGKVREVIRFLYGADRAEAIEEEVLEILRADGRTPGSLRDWFRNRTATELGRNFFDFHVRRYSKSRRKAPIYWRLCSNPGRGQSQYAVWLYSHRLTDDTLWTVLNSYLGPKLERVEQRTEKLRSETERTEGSESRRLEEERAEALELLEELRWFEGELRKVAESGWRPELDDGVVINVAPFHKVMRWNEPEKHWKRLQKGEYDWSLTAMRYWPDRVRERCRTDRSLGIAHGLEELYEGE